MEIISTVEPPVSDHSKFEDLVLAYGRQSRTSIQPEVGSLSRYPNTSTFWKKIHCMQFSSYDMSRVSCCH